MFYNCLTNLLLIVISVKTSSVHSYSTSLSKLHVKQSQLVRSGLSNILWEYIDSVDLTLLGLTDNCVKGLNHVIKSLEQGNQWTLEMMDASGRAPVDLTGIGYLETGNYKQCLSLSWSGASVTPEVGQYCLISMLPILNTNKSNIFIDRKVIEPRLEMIIKIGLCLPSSCTTNDVQRITAQALDKFAWKVTKVDNCETGQTFADKLWKASLIQKMTLLFLLTIVTIVFTSTYLEDKSTSFNLAWMKHFSLYQSYRSLTEPDKNMDRMPFLTKSSIFVHLSDLPSHIFMWPFFLNSFTLIGESLFSLRSAAPYIIYFGETIGCYLVVHGGIARSMMLWRNTKSDTPILKTLSLIFKKAVCLSFIIAILVLLQNLIPLFSSGPLNSIVTKTGCEGCIPNFYSYVFFFHNFKLQYLVDLCLPHTWSIAVEFQIIIFLIILAHIYKKSPFLGLITNIFFIIGSLAYVGRQFYYSNAGPHVLSKFSYEQIKEWYLKFYLDPFVHLYIYCSTMLYTFLIMNCDKNSKIIQLFLKNVDRKSTFILTLANLCPIIWVTFLERYEYPIFLATYSVFYRILVAIYYAIYLLQNYDEFRVYFGNATDKKITQIKSKINPVEYKRLHIISSITESVYFTHSTVITWFYAQQKWPLISSSQLICFVIYIGITAFVAALAFFFIVLAPLKSIYSNFTNHAKKS